MTILTHDELLQLDAIDAPVEHINPASIEVTLGRRFYIERNDPWIVRPGVSVVDFFKRDLPLQLVELAEGESMLLKPGAFALAETQEWFDLPLNIVAEYVLKSSQARRAWGHLLAGYCDPGWHGSRLTMEFVNHSQFEPLLLTPGVKCGQMKFHAVTPVPEDKSYRVTGRYNNQTTVQSAK